MAGPGAGACGKTAKRERPPAIWVVDEVQRARSGEAAAREGARLLVVVGVVFVVGLGLMFGNVTGLFPTFPFAGFLTTGLGSLLVTVGQSRS